MSAVEKHYNTQQISELWGLSPDVVRRLFDDEPGVIKIGKPETRFKRKKFTLRVPESVVIRVHERLRN